MSKHRFKVLDVVQTKFKTICVVEDVSLDGRVSLVIPPNSKQKTAWYEPEELILIGSVKELVGLKDNVYAQIKNT